MGGLGAAGFGGGTTAAVKSRSSSLSAAAGGDAGAAGLGTEGAGAALEATSRTNPSLANYSSNWKNLASGILSNFLLISDSVVLPSTWASTARSARERMLDLPEASSMPLPVFEQIEEPFIVGLVGWKACGAF